jgi:hypothetical protein
MGGEFMQKTVLSKVQYPKIVTDLASQNQFLKTFSYSCLGLTALMALVLVYSIKKGPQVIALDNTGEVARVETALTDLQVKSAVREYLSHRYNWDPATAQAQLKKTEVFIYPSLIGSFQKSMVAVLKFIHDKKVTQRVYPQKIDVDFKAKVITVVADRINEFENLKAATVLKLKLNFEVDDRTAMNPWGIYVTKELEGAD